MREKLSFGQLPHCVNPFATYLRASFLHQAVLVARHWSEKMPVPCPPGFVHSAQHHALKVLLLPCPVMGALAAVPLEEEAHAWLEKALSIKINSLDPCAKADPGGGEWHQGDGAPSAESQPKGRVFSSAWVSPF